MSSWHDHYWEETMLHFIGKIWCTTWMLTKHMEKKLDGNYTRMLRAILNKSWRQHPTKQQLYGYLPPITKTIKMRQTRHAGHCWRSRDELISDVLQWIPSHGCAKAGWPAQTYIQQLRADTGCNPENLPEAIDNREGWRERVRDIHADSATWWWWWWYEFYNTAEVTKNICFVKREDMVGCSTVFGLIWFYGISLLVI